MDELNEAEAIRAIRDARKLLRQTWGNLPPYTLALTRRAEDRIDAALVAMGLNPNDDPDTKRLEPWMDSAHV